jgi:hypothetical protein
MQSIKLRVHLPIHKSLLLDWKPYHCITHCFHETDAYFTFSCSPRSPKIIHIHS